MFGNLKLVLRRYTSLYGIFMSASLTLYIYTLLCYFHQLSASILFIVARLSEKVIGIVLVVCCLWCVVLLG